jgi:hypothetical protein
MPALDDPVGEPPHHRCGRCRKDFPLERGADPRTASDWWACGPCRATLLPDRRP